MELALTIVYLLVCVFIVAVVLLQPSKDMGMGSSFGGAVGGAETYFGKNKARTWEGRLAVMTQWGAALFIILSIVLIMMK